MEFMGRTGWRWMVGIWKLTELNGKTSALTLLDFVFITVLVFKRQRSGQEPSATQPSL